MIPRSFIQDLLNRLDIVDVIERYVPLKKAGANFVACCPFHTEKSPSFTVSQAKQFYHCFGCGAHGTAITFVMDHLGMAFVDAIEELAKSVAMPVPHERTAQAENDHKVAPNLYELMQTATRFYRDQLKLSARAIAYLQKRGLSGEIAQRFGIGYAPDDWQNLKNIVNYQDVSLVNAGLVKEGEGGKRYDYFRDRIMFPIINGRGQVIGFGGRVLDKGDPKYLNSPETMLFEKGRELYGLFQAQKSIREHKTVVVVEGYMDVVALAQLGVDYAVATLGTATTPFHIQKLLKLSEQIVFCFDGDRAGKKAAWRALENALPQLQDGKRIGFLFLPEEHDPDSYIREFGCEAFERELNNAVPLSGYLLRELTASIDLHTAEGRSALLKNAQPLLTTMTAPSSALLLRKEVAALAGVTQAELEALYQIKPVAARRAAPLAKAKRPAPSGLRTLLRCLVMQPALAQQLPTDWHDDSAEGSAIMALADWLREAADVTSTAALVQSFQGTAHESVLVAAQAEVMLWQEDFDVSAEFAGTLAKLRDEERHAELNLLHQKMQGRDLKALNDAEKMRYLQLLQRH